MTRQDVSVRASGGLSFALRLPLRLALRDLRGGVKGFGIFIACIALGVAAIAGVGSVARGLSEGLAREGRAILGGDVAVTLIQRRVSAEEQAFLEAQGQVSSSAELRAMASVETAAGTPGEAALVELKAVDALYPAVGALQSDPQEAPDKLFAAQDGVFGAVADPVLLARLGVERGAIIRIGGARLRISAALVAEPDRAAAGIGFGPRLLVSQEALQASGLLQPGSIVRWNYGVLLPGGEGDDAALARFESSAKAAFPDQGWRIRTRLDAAPRLQGSIERFSQYLTLVGLTALLVGGVGVANAVRGFVDRKIDAMATMKSLGATGGMVVTTMLVEVMLIASIGIVIGLVLGAAMPFAVAFLARDILPLPLHAGVAPLELALAALYGALTALVFAIIPVGRARDVPVAVLFRERAAQLTGRPRRVYLLAAAAAALLLVGLALVQAHDRRVAAVFVLAAVAAVILLRAVANATMALARRIPRPQGTVFGGAVWRLALANIHRPGALTPTMMLSLGLGVTLVVTLMLVDAGLKRELTRSLPESAPTYFFLDIQAADSDRFTRFLEQAAPGASIEHVPMMRGRLVTLKGIRAQDYPAPEEVTWVLEGDRGITFSEQVPENSTLTEGAWWPADYTGKTLVSFDAEIARQLGLKVGDVVTVNVLGRTIEAEIANLRTVEWRSLAINFVMVFSPSAFQGAPYTVLATLTDENDAQPESPTLVRDIAAAFPSVTSVRVRDVLLSVNEMAAQLGLAIAGASSIALLACALVLAGALAASHRARLYDAVILKTLGATRFRLLAAYGLEYSLVGLVAAIFGFLAGTAAAGVIMTQVMNLPFVFVPAPAAFAAICAIVTAILLGLPGTWRILTQKPATVLRDL